MATIMICVAKLVGRSRAAAELGRRLAAAGHEVCYAADPVTLAQTAPAALRTRPLPEIALGGPAAEALGGSRRQRVLEMANRLGVDACREAIDAVAPDLALIDFELHPAIIAALSAQTRPRIALFTEMFAGAPGLRAPPLSGSIVPGRGVAGSRVGVAAAWASLWVDGARRRARRLRRAPERDYGAVLSAAAEAAGLRLSDWTTRWRWQRPFAWRRFPLLILQSRAMEFEPSDGAMIQYVGPMRPDQNALNAAGRELIDQIDAEKSQGCEMVYVAFGSIKKPPTQLIEAIWDAAARMPARRFIQAGPARSERTPPENVMCVDWAPQSHVLERSDAALTAAGVNTIIECIEAGTPMLCAPFAVNDQPGNAARVAYHGLGAVLPLASTASDIALRLDSVIGDRKARRSIAAMRDAFAADRDALLAERAVDRLLRDPRLT